MITNKIDVYYDYHILDFYFLSNKSANELKIYFENLLRELNVDFTDLELSVKLLSSLEDEHLDFDLNDNINFVQLYADNNGIKNNVDILQIHNDYGLKFKEILRREDRDYFKDPYKIDSDSFSYEGIMKEIIKIDLENLKNNPIVRYFRI